MSATRKEIYIEHVDGETVRALHYDGGNVVDIRECVVSSGSERLLAGNWASLGRDDVEIRVSWPSITEGRARRADKRIGRHLAGFRMWRS